MKTGSTSIAKRNLVSTAERNGLRLVAVVLGVGVTNGHFTESMKLLNFGFNQFEFAQIYQKGDKVTSINVSKGAVDEIDLVAAKNVGGIKKKGEEVNLTTEISVSEYAAAPIIKGTKLGEVAVLKNGRELERVDLIAAADVARAGLGRQIKKIIDQVLLAVK